MNQLDVLNIVELRKQNNDTFNIEVTVPLNDKVGVIVKTNPSTDIISSVVQTYTETLMNEQEDMSGVTSDYLQYFLLGVLLKHTTNISCHTTTCAEYVDMVIQLIRADYIKKIIAAFGDDYERILQEISIQLTEYSKILSETKKKVSSKTRKKPTSTSKKVVAK